MAFALRHRASTLVVLAALLGTAAVFAFARPQYHRPYESEMIDLADRHYYSPDAVRDAFAAQDLHLRYSSRFAGVIFLSTTPPPWPDTTLIVNVAGRTGKISWGPELESVYEERFGNLDVQFGGSDPRVLARIKAAVAALAALPSHFPHPRVGSRRPSSSDQ